MERADERHSIPFTRDVDLPAPATAMRTIDEVVFLRALKKSTCWAEGAKLAMSIPYPCLGILVID
jgi:hypothetical protein